jgi:hypothetical protein
MNLAAYKAFGQELRKLASSKEHRAQLFEALRKGSPVKIKMDRGASQQGGGYFDQVKNEIGLSKKDYAVLAHELGHAEVQEHLYGKAIQHPIVRRAFSLTPLAALGAGILMAKGKKWGIALPLLTAVPTLMSEGVATWKGGKKLKELKADKQERRGYRAQMAQGLISYAIQPAVQVAQGVGLL